MLPVTMLQSPQKHCFVNHYDKGDISFAKGIPSYEEVHECVISEIGKKLGGKVKMKQWCCNEPIALSHQKIRVEAL